MMNFNEISSIVSPLVGIGFLFGCFPLLFGIGIRTIINILKNI